VFIFKFLYFLFSISLNFKDEFMEHRLIIILFIAFGMIFGGVIGYRLIEGWSFLDSLYMTIITISTVGFQEVYPLSRLGRIFTISLIITGVFVVTLTISYIVSLLAEGRFGQFMKRREMKMDLKKNRESLHHLWMWNRRWGNFNRIY